MTDKRKKKARGTSPKGTGASSRGTGSKPGPAAEKSAQVPQKSEPKDNSDSQVRPINVWASGPDIPTNVCFDARLGGAPTKLQYPHGTTKGQAGWDMGVNFKSLEDLAIQLTRKPREMPGHVCGNSSGSCGKLRAGQINRLAINVHGTVGGEALVNGKKRKKLEPETIGDYRGLLEEIGQAVRSPGGLILLMGCVAGLGKDGSKLLKGLSKIWNGRKVVGFITIGYQAGGEMKRRSTTCSEPGMRSTIHTASSGVRREGRPDDSGALWDKLDALPWSSEDVTIPRENKKTGEIIRVPVAKIALDGAIIQLDGL